MELFKDTYGILELVAAKKPVPKDDDSSLVPEPFWDELEIVLQKAQYKPNNPLTKKQ